MAAASRPPRPGPGTVRPAHRPAVPTPAGLHPLRALAAALGAAGSRTPGYSGLTIDAASGRVEVFVTGGAAARAVTASARRAAPSLDWSDAQVRTARYTHAALTRAAVRLMHSHPEVNRIAVPADGSGLDVTTTDRRDTLSDVGVAVHVTVAAPDRAKSWAQSKWHDSSPFIGGDTLTPDGYHYCTSGLPAVYTSTRKPVMVTAGHCFATGTRVHTAAGTPGAFHNRLTGNYVGTVVARSQTWDSELLVGAANTADESDRTGWKVLSSAAYSYEGDYVCQNGAWSFFAGHPTPCGIKVTHGDIWFKIDGYWARGVEGIDVLHGWGAHAGDSGATVFALEANNTRQARGIVSSGGADGTVDQRRVDWIEAPDIFAAFGLRLNPQT